MADVKISGLPASTTPLAGTEVLPIVQSGATKQVSVANLTAARAVSAANLAVTGATIAANGLHLPAANSLGVSTNTTERIRIDSSGNVGVGLTSPAAKLHVIGNNGTNGTASFTTTDGNGGVSISGYGGVAYIQGQATATGASVPLVLNQNGGNVSVAGGNLVIGTSGKGIDFSATAGTGTSELLADYEEGTWTPAAVSIGGTITSFTSSGLYTKVGRLVTVQATVDITDNGTGSVFVRITNLPFTPSSNIFAGSGRDAGTTGNGMLTATTAGDGTTNLNIFTYASAYPGGTGASICVTITYSV
jgi:hypothetical protein